VPIRAGRIYLITGQAGIFLYTFYALTPSLRPDARRPALAAPRTHVLLLMVRTCAVLLAAVVLAAAQMGMDQMPKKPKPAPLNKDVPYIKCQACEIMAARALAQVKI